MENQNTDAEAKLKKLGHHVRLGWAKQEVVSDKNLETVRGAVREQWQKEQAVKPAKATEPSPVKDKPREPEEPDLGR